ncbi:MAG: PepSY domain-containing protein [Solirubrobacterales bacterium]
MIGRIVWSVVAVAAVAVLVYTGIWHVVTLFLWQHPMLSWVPLLVMIVVGYAVGAVGMLASDGPAPAASVPPPKPSEALATAGAGEAAASAPAHAAPATAAQGRRRPPFRFGWGFLAGFVVLLLGLFFTLVSPREMSLDAIDYEVVETLPQQTQPRLLPRTGVTDNPAFRDADEIHLVRDPESGNLVYTGEWRSRWNGGPSGGVSIRPLDDLIEESEIQMTGFVNSVAGITPRTLKGKAKIGHPFSRIQYPILVPDGKDDAFAMAPYTGYSGFPFPQPEFEGVLVYHRDGTIEDISPEVAATRPELVRTGRIFPEAVARAQAEALAASDEIDGEIVDGEGNKQPFLTSIDRDRTVWLTVIDSNVPQGGVKALVLADSSTGETQVWEPPTDQPLISTEDVLNKARALPLRWEEERCCDSDGNSYTVTLREVVEPRLAFHDAKPYYLVTIVPTDDLALSREVEYTLLIDAQTGEELDRFEHVNGLKEDVRLQAFFSEPG